MKRYISVSAFILLALVLPAQIIETSPAIVTMGQPVTIYYNSDEDQGALNNYTGDIYTHTGVIISGNDDWQKVIGTWGDNSAQPMLTYLGDYRYKLEITPSIEDFYPGMTGDEEVIKLAFVFRNATAGKQTADLFVDVYEAGLNVNITTPVETTVVAGLNEDLQVEASATLADSLVLFIDDIRTYKSDNDTLLAYTVAADQYGGRRIRVTAYNEPDKVSDSLWFFVKDDPVIEALPAGVEDGISYISDNSVTLVLTAPGKTDAFVIGDFNDWLVCEEGYMKKTPDGERFWISIDGLVAGDEYRFQYLVDGSIRIGDPYAEKVLDPWNDKYISEDTYPGLIPYPEGRTTGLVTVLQPGAPEYEWAVTGFEAPPMDELVIYEMLMRDFLETHHYRTLTDSLNYLDSLGINAIELMPVNEFDGNLSWGYNPAYYLAPDKYYGRADDLRVLIDSCHRRGIAVILDVVLNHSTGSSPLAALYWDDEANNVTAENPWYNVSPTHDYNVFHDFNHESGYTRYFARRVMTHWIEEYRVDGYRFDLSKGFTQNNTLGNVAAWGAYDASRVAIWKMYADHIWSVDPGFHIILEHFADNSEEKELAEYGMMLWGNMNHAYSELSMGYDADISPVSYLERGWAAPHLIAYMESHDEERMQYRNLQYGASYGDYDVSDPATGLDRLALAATMFFTVPGPKMIWQFGELGYDYSIDHNGRTGEKPIKWDYYTVPERNRLYRVFASLIKLRRENAAFSSADFEVLDDGKKKRVKISHESMNVIAMGNFDVESGLLEGGFHHTGRWYEFFTGDSLEVDNTSVVLTLQAGEYRIYTSERLETPDLSVGVDDIAGRGQEDIPFTVYPNPVRDRMYIERHDDNMGRAMDIVVMDMAGRRLLSVKGHSGSYIDLSALPRGLYLINISSAGSSGSRSATRRFIKL